MNVKQLRARLDEYVSGAKTITRRAESEARVMTSDEHAEVERLIARATEVKDLLTGANDKAARDSLAALSGGSTGAGDLYGAFKAAGFEPGKKAIVPAPVAFKTVSFDTGDLATMTMPRYEGPVLGADRRKVYEVFPTTAVDAATTSVEVFRQTSRTLASSDYGWVHRAIDSAGKKIETASAFELVQKAMEMVASIQSAIPNIMLLQDGVRSIVNADLLLSYQRGLEDIVVDAIMGSGYATGSSGSTFASAVLYAAKDQHALGYNGRIVLMNEGDLITQLIKKGSTEAPFAFGNPIDGFETIVVPTLAAGTAFLVDPAAFGRQYLSAVSLQTFEESAGQTNTSTVRLEGSATFNVERVAAITKLNSVA